MSVYALGRFRVECDGDPLDLPSRGKLVPFELLKLLIARGGEQVSTEELSETLWPDADGDNAHRSLNSALHRLRGKIGRETLTLRGGRLTLEPQRCWVDALAFQAALKRADRALSDADVDAAVPAVNEAMALYGGEFLPGEFDLPEVLAFRDRLRSAFIRLAVELGAVHVNRSEVEQAITLYRKGLEIDSRAEALSERLMDCYRQTGRFVEAIAHYEHCRQLFQTQWNAEPSEGMQALYDAILADQRRQQAPPAHDRVRAAAPAPTPAPPTEEASERAPATDTPPVARDGERRRATVLFADLVGYTGLCERLDPEEVDAIMTRVKTAAVPIVELHGGVVKQFVGDEVMAIFGVPETHEDDPSRAVQAALALHRAVAELPMEDHPAVDGPLRLHSAVNTGLMVVKNTDSLDGRFAVTGEVITTAARLRSLAPADEVWVSEETASLIAPNFETEPCAPVQIEGKEQPIVPARVLRPGRYRSRFDVAKARGLTPLCGREAELDTLRGCLDTALGGQGQFVTVAGEAGLGKSRLLHEFMRTLDRSQVIVLRGRCQLNDTATPFRPFVDLLRGGLRLHEEEASSITSEQVVQQVRAIVPSVEPYLPCYLHLLSVPSAEHPLPQNLDAQALTALVMESLSALVVQGLQLRPIVIVLEDWHWADHASEAGLRTVLDVIARHPLLVVLSYRQEYEGRWGNPHHHTHILLKPLQRSHAERMVCTLTGAETLPAGLVERIYRQTEGNPLFIEELTRALLESGEVQVREGRASMKLEPEALIIPDTVQAVIHSRLDRLDAQEAELLRLAAVIGDEFTPRVLAAVAPATIPIWPTLDRLNRLELIHPVEMVPEARFGFNHAITRLVVYETLLMQRRAVLHEQVALAIEALYADRLPEYHELLAHHFSRSANTPKALDYLERAGDKAAQLFALIEARRYYREGVERLQGRQEPPEERVRCIDLALKWGAVSFYAPSLALLEALEAAHTDARALQDEARVARTSFWCGMMHYALGNHSQALARLKACQDLPEVMGNAEVRTLTTNYLGRVLFYLAEFDKACACLEAGVPLLEEIGREIEGANSLGVLAIARGFRGEFPEAARLIELAMRIAERSENPGAQSVAHVSKAIVAVKQGAWEAVREPARIAQETAARIGNAMMEGTALWAHGYALAQLDDLDGGLALMHKGFALIEGTDSNLGLSAYCGHWALACAEAGRRKEAVSLADKALALAKDGGDRLGEHMAYGARAILAAQATPQNWKAATTNMNKALEAADRRGMRPDLATLRLHYARLLHLNGEAAAARQQLAQARRAFDELGMAGWSQAAAALAGELGQGRRGRPAAGGRSDAARRRSRG